MMFDSIIIGGGIAGCSVARSLAERGHKVLLLERTPAPATGASGNPLGVLYPQLTKVWTPLSRFSFMAYAYMQRQLTSWQTQGLHDIFMQPGMIQLPRSDDDLLKFENLHEKLQISESVITSYSLESIRSFMPHYVGERGLYFPYGAALNVRAACRYYLNHSHISMHANAPVADVTQHDQGWRVVLENNESFSSKQLVICNATDLLKFEQTSHLPLSWNRGQLSYLSRHSVTHPLKKIVCHKGYIVPMLDGGYLIGATYDREFHGCEPRASDHEENLAAVRAQFPGWVKDEVCADQLDGRASLRSVSKDRAPLIGQATDGKGMPLKGLYISVAHGSRGLLTAPMGAQYLAHLMTNAPFSGIPIAIEKALSPARFVKP